MWSWLRKLINSLRETEQEYNGNLPPVSTTRQLQVKTKNIYPRERESQRETNRVRPEKQRRFRFPVIPDQPSINKVRETAAKKSETLPTREKAAVSPEEKRAYKPTEVISPIYGKIKPEQQAYRSAPASPIQEQPVKTEAPHFYAGQAEPEESKPWVQQVRQMQDEAAASASLAEPDELVGSAGMLEIAVDKSDAFEAAAERTWGSEAADGHEEFEVEETGSVENDATDPQPELAWLMRQSSGQADSSAEEAEPALARDTADTGLLFEPSAEMEGEEPLYRQTDYRNRFLSSDDWEDEDQAAEKETRERPIVLQSWMNAERAGTAHQTIPALPQETVRPAAADFPPVAVQSGLEHLQHTYKRPSLDLLNPSPQLKEDHYEHTLEQKQLLEETLNNFNVSAQVVGIVKGPSVTRFELQPAPGVKVNKITGLTDDIKLNMAAKDIRIEAPIPGRNAVGIEVPNLKSEPIFISRIIGSEKFRSHPSPLAIALGMDIGGEPIVADIKKMPHGLIAGSTGSGKSVCINSIIVSLLYKATPEQVRLLLIDPKMVELAPYNHLPHLVTPVVTDAKQATAALKWAVEEMEKRYALFVDAGVRDIDRYNVTTDEPLPYIVIIIDELADLMMVSPQDVEDCIIRIAQKARACGIHLLLATQRPSVDVITGNIKANVPTRLAFAVFSQVDSRTILDQTGAERLLGRGDMLFLESGATPLRLQGNYVSDDEIERITQMIKKQRKPEYLFSKEELEQSMQSYDMGDDPLYHEALLFVAEQGQASASALQRRFRIGYNRAARLIEMMEAEGHVAGQSGGKPRAVLITREDAQALTEGTSLF